MTTFAVVRHGQSEWHDENRALMADNVSLEGVGARVREPAR